MGRNGNMREKIYGKKGMIFFFVPVIILSGITEVLYCTGGDERLILFLMWIPALAAIAAVCADFIIGKERFSFKVLLYKTGFKKCKFRYIVLAFIVPFIYLLIPYMIYWKIYPENFAYNGVGIAVIIRDCFLVMVVGFISNMITAIGEEIGWRGFLVPALFEKIGLFKTLAVTGLFWCCWHLPLLIFGGYMDGTLMWYRIPAFILCIFPVGMIAGLLSLRTGSVWPAAVLHAAHNNFDQMIFDVITAGDNKAYFVSETGFLTIICVWIIAIIMYFRYRRSISENVL